MRLSIITGAILASLTGMAIAMQATITSRIGAQIGDIRTGILTNLMGGLLAGGLMLAWLLRDGPEYWQVKPVLVGFTVLSGFLGIVIITGISFSLQRAGVAAGLAGVIFGQLVLSTVIDSLGIGGGEPVPFTITRGIGVLVTGFGVYLLLPKS
jgi:transporter family-2 protein